MERKNHNIVKVKVGGVEYDTVLVKGDLQRFVQNDILARCVENGLIDMNRARILYHEGKMGTKRQYAEFHMAIGYSVRGFEELSLFQDMEIENPLWEKDEETGP